MIAGSIFFDESFIFHDGEEAAKLLVVLGYDRGVVVVAKTTSQPHGRGIIHGCQPSDRFHNFHLVLNSCNLKKPTWICLDEFYELQENKLLERRFSGKIKHRCDLPQELIKPLLECALMSEDITAHQEAVIKIAFSKL